MWNRFIAPYIRSAQKLLIRLNVIAYEAAGIFLYVLRRSALPYIQLLGFTLLDQVLPIIQLHSCYVLRSGTLLILHRLNLHCS